MNLIAMASVLLSQSDVAPSPASGGFELAIWKWVVVIGAGAFVVIFALKRIGDVVAKKRTESMIEEVVGKGESQKNTAWVEDEIGEEQETESDDVSAQSCFALFFNNSNRALVRR